MLDSEVAINITQDIMRLYHTGNEERAWHLLAMHYYKLVYNTCLRLLFDAQLASDISQDVFIVAHRDLMTFEGRSTLRAWILAIARHRVLNAMKSRDRRQSHEAPFAMLAEAYDPAPAIGEAIDNARWKSALQSSIRQLPEYTRHVLLMRYESEFTYEEMAIILGKKAGTLQAMVNRTLRSLRQESCLASFE